MVSFYSDSNALFNRLSQRELDCAAMACLGLSSKEIAIHLKLSMRTVEHYLESIKKKLGCKKKREITMLFFRLDNDCDAKQEMCKYIDDYIIRFSAEKA